MSIDEEVPRHRSRKDRKRWCRGKVGVPHVPGAPELSSFSQGMSGRYGWKPCRWSQTYRSVGLGAARRPEPRGDWTWWCSHVRRCERCGKGLDYSLGVAECPSYAPRGESTEGA